MKIFCIVDNYNAGATTETENEANGEFLWYMLPDSTVVRSDNPMFVPDFSDSFVAYPSMVVRIEKIGKNISPKFSSRYYKSVAPGLAVQAPGLLADLRKKGFPWTKAVLFDKCCILGEFVELTEEGMEFPRIDYDYGGKGIIWKADALERDVDHVIAELSRENTLKIGDLIFVGLSPDGFNLKIGESITAKIRGEIKLNMRLR